MSRRDLLRGQFDLVWSLFDYHLQRLEPADLWWEPAGRCWTVRRDADGRWRPDWAEPEPDPPPVPTIAWLTWHIGWWWETATDHVRGRAPRDRTDVVWPGDGAAVAWLRGLREGWLRALDALGETGLDAPSAYPWPGGTGRTMADLVAWVNAELMKNAAEIGQLRMLRAAQSTPG